MHLGHENLFSVYLAFLFVFPGPFPLPGFLALLGADQCLGLDFPVGPLCKNLLFDLHVDFQVVVNILLQEVFNILRNFSDWASIILLIS